MNPNDELLELVQLDVGVVRVGLGQHGVLLYLHVFCTFLQNMLFLPLF